MSGKRKIKKEERIAIKKEPIVIKKEPTAIKKEPIGNSKKRRGSFVGPLAPLAPQAGDFSSATSITAPDHKKRKVVIDEFDELELTENDILELDAIVNNTI